MSIENLQKEYEKRLKVQSNRGGFKESKFIFNIGHDKTMGQNFRPYKQARRVTQLDIKTNEIIAIFDSVNLAAHNTGFSTSGISRCALGKIKTSMGYKWSYDY